jgi:hypothetical protein
MDLCIHIDIRVYIYIGTAISSSVQIAPGMPDEYRRIKPVTSPYHSHTCLMM